MKFFLALSLVACVTAAPLTETLAKYYAMLHPNDFVDNPEYGEYYEGDIRIADKGDFEVGQFNAMTSTLRMWPGGVMPYTMGTYTSAGRNAILAGIDDLVTSTMVNGQKCIDIIPRTSQINYVNVYSDSGCYSYIGQIGGRQTISLTSGCWNRHGTIMHEFLHAYGFYHEQSRYDRDPYITINWDNIQSGAESNFQMKSESDINLLGTAYDYGSVMHYGAYAFAIDPNVPTIVTSDPNAIIGQRVALSAIDIERVQIFYGCLAVEDSKYFKHLADKIAEIELA